MSEIQSRWLDFYHKEKQEAVKKRIKKTSMIIATGNVYSQRMFMVFEFDKRRGVPKCIVKGTDVEYSVMEEKAQELEIDIIQDAGFIESWFGKIKCDEKIPQELYRYFIKIVTNNSYIMKMIYEKK